MADVAIEVPHGGDGEDYVRTWKRRKLMEQKILQRRGRGIVAATTEAVNSKSEAKPILLVKALQLKKDAPKISTTEHMVRQELEMLGSVSEEELDVRLRARQRHPVQYT